MSDNATFQMPDVMANRESAARVHIAELEAELAKARTDQNAARKEAADWRKEWEAAVLAEREACCEIVQRLMDQSAGPGIITAAIRARPAP